jgi:hypothetical protein
MGKVNVNEIDKETGSTLTLGGSGTAVTLACGATQTGFGRTGTVDWQTGSVKTATFTAANGEGYFANTSGGAFNMNLPVGSAGSIVSIADYGNTFQTNNLTIVPNGSQLVGGVNANAILSTQGQSVTFVYVDGTKGWVNTMDSTSNVRGNAFITASGGTVVTCGNFKTHIFTGSTNFVVSAVATCAPNNVADYLVVAGGGGAGKSSGGGGGGGGFRMSNDLCMPAPQTSPLAIANGITLTAQSYPITIGAGGAGTCSPGSGTQGGPSIFSTVTSAGGGFGEPYGVTTASGTGGSGGGGGTPAPGQPNTAPTPAPALFTPGSAGNTPPTSPSQGNNGGAGFHRGAISSGGGGGGGGCTVGGQARDSTVSGTAGGTAYLLTDAAGGFGGTGSYIAEAMIGPTSPSYGTTGPVTNARYFAGGGGGGGGAGGYAGGPIPEMNGGGSGGGGNGGLPGNMPGPSGASNRGSTAGTTNTGGGGGGAKAACAPDCRASGGGSGIVMIRYRYQ